MNSNFDQNLFNLKSNYIPEPDLEFADKKQFIDPKFGISRVGPKSYKPLKRHPTQVRVGFIGSAESVDHAKEWLDIFSEGVEGDEDHLEFPGYMSDRGFFSNLIFDDSWIEKITHSESTLIQDIRSSRDRFSEFISLIENKLSLLADKDQPPEYIVLSLPDDLYNRCKTVEYNEKKFGKVHRDFRRSFKAIAMKYRIPTQIVRQNTLDSTPLLRLDGRRAKDYPSEIGWDFFTGLYFKAGGFPWGPVGLTPGTCYIGIGFYRPLGSDNNTLQTSLVQAFDEHGDGLVLRGHEFQWDSKENKNSSPHLSENLSYDLVNLVLDKYSAEMRQNPNRVVIHKTSRFWPEEKNGFIAALQKRVKSYDLLALSPQSTIRLFPTNKYPPLRGTHFSIGKLDFLYTTGYLADLGQFHSVHVPSPLQVADHIGFDTPRETLLKEILILTKMNWNSSKLGGLWPITLRFSKLVGNIMREIPKDREPLTNFKFYM